MSSSQSDKRARLVGDGTTASAPGKVLLVGGYAVLDKENHGIVCSTSTRFATTCRWLDCESLPSDGQRRRVRVHVSSPQWSNWTGKFVFDCDTCELRPEIANARPNRYVENTLGLTLSYLFTSDSTAMEVKEVDVSSQGKVLSVLLLADNGFYSQQATLRERGLPLDSRSLASLPPHLPVEADKVAKTGLGSSAAMITSLVAALARHLAPRTAKPETIHRLAQLAHSIAQGKIGSGFDVCSACYGSMFYRRYDPHVLDGLMNEAGKNGASSSSIPAAREVCRTVEDMSGAWDYVCEQFSLPAGVELVCGDVAGGSETPSMSRAILAWKGAKLKEPPSEWLELLSANAEAMRALKELCALGSSKENANEYEEACRILSGSHLREMIAEDEGRVISPSMRAFRDVARSFHKARVALRRVGEAAKVPVEPPSQTKILDATAENVRGVLACGVPGAGGFDAVFVLMVTNGGKDATCPGRRAVEAFWREHVDGVCALDLSESREGGLKYL